MFLGIDWWEKLGWIDTATSERMHDQRARELAAIAQDHGFRTYAHEHLAQSNAALVAIQLDDVLGSVEAQNLPGTIDAHPNWRRKYTVSLTELTQDSRLKEAAEIMRRAARAHSNAR